jgi:hypothetical protein
MVIRNFKNLSWVESSGKILNTVLFLFEE